MLDITSEKLIPLKAVPPWCEEILGKRVHISTVFRWHQRGVRGIKLETILMGGGRFTSVEALIRFCDATTYAGNALEGGNRQSFSKKLNQSLTYLSKEGLL
jgi:hypothetical protein